MIEQQLSTGLPGLDRVLRGVMPGDNFVWQVESLADFTPFAKAFCEAALAEGRKIVYFRFADHEPLVPESLGAEVHRLRRDEEFEPFVTEVHRVIEEAGPQTHFVFDCLSNLVDVWFSDRMLGNFFMLTCPTVFRCQSLAYFPLIRHRHSFHASGPITETTQILIDVFRHRGRFYIHPTKVEHRFSSTMHMLHRWDGDRFLPVMESSTTAEVLTSRPWAGLESVRLRPGKWTRTFFQAEEVSDKIRRGKLPAEAARQLLPELLRMVISRDERVGPLVERYFTLPDVVEIWKRMIGSGLIGGKSVGMLLARAILRSADRRWSNLLEAHDSFFIGSNVFCSFMVENGCWWLRRKQRDPETFLDGIEEAQQRVLAGNFPQYLVDEFAEMLDYFGQSPIIVRSSSLLEDNYGNAFAGKYESVFCANQGPHAKRLAGLPLGRQDGLRQHDERKGPAIPRPARAAGPRRADVASGAAGLRRLLRHPVLPADRRRRTLAQPLRLERVHRPQCRSRAAGVRPGHAGGRPLGRRLHADRRPQRPGPPARRRFGSRPAVQPAQGRSDRPGGQPSRVARFHRRGGRRPSPSAAHFRFRRRRRLAAAKRGAKRRALRSWS